MFACGRFGVKKVVLYALSAFFIGRTGRRRSPFGRLPREEGKPPEGGFFPSRGPVFGSRPKIPAAPAGAPNKKSRTSRKSRRAKKLWNKQKSSSFCILPQAWKIPGEKLIRMIILSLANKTKNRQPIKKFFKTATRALLPSLIFEIPTPPERPRLAAYWRRRNILFRKFCRFFYV